MRALAWMGMLLLLSANLARAEEFPFINAECEAVRTVYLEYFGYPNQGASQEVMSSLALKVGDFLRATWGPSGTVAKPHDGYYSARLRSKSPPVPFSNLTVFYYADQGRVCAERIAHVLRPHFTSAFALKYPMHLENAGKMVSVYLPLIERDDLAQRIGEGLTSVVRGTH